MKTVTVLVPCYNEEDILWAFYNRLNSVFNALPEYCFSILFVDDGSTDSSLEKLRSLRNLDHSVSFLSLSRNFGKETAMLAGLDYVQTDSVILIDADLQDPPELIPELIKFWEEGFDDVYARRICRNGETFLKKCGAYLYYRILRRLSDIDIPVDVGDFRLLDKRCVKALCSMRERQRYTKGLFSWVGFRKKEILFERDARFAGDSGFNFFKLLGLAVDGITSFSIIPLRFASVLGLILSFTSCAYMAYVWLKTLVYGDPVAGYPSLVCIILFIAGFQFLVLGIIGEYIGRIFVEVKHRPEYVAAEYNGKKNWIDPRGMLHG